MIDQTISQYKIVEKLGESSMSSFNKNYNDLIPPAGGVVYKTESTKLKHIVALKIVSQLRRPIGI